MKWTWPWRRRQIEIDKREQENNLTIARLVAENSKAKEERDAAVKALAEAREQVRRMSQRP
jgi:hypothetical protein